jgi:Ca2+-binding EF-hand superfamily protein
MGQAPLINKLILAVAAVLVTASAAAPVPPLEQSRRQHFERLDTNHDGKVSREEFLAPWQRHREIAEKQFRQFDKNGDGYLSPEEYLPARKKAPGGK